MLLFFPYLLSLASLFSFVKFRNEFSSCTCQVDGWDDDHYGQDETRSRKVVLRYSPLLFTILFLFPSSAPSLPPSLTPPSLLVLILSTDTVVRKKLYDKVDADSALSVLENDILTDNRPITKVFFSFFFYSLPFNNKKDQSNLKWIQIEGVAIMDQPESLVQDIEEIGKWAKKKKPTWEAIKAFFPIVNWMKDYKVFFSSLFSTYAFVLRSFNTLFVLFWY